ncbi:GvpL/GvpF family gas vesicle protein [Streptomyces antibioticus]|uniref:GvpL/GvpF family gas vesicle protein n=1 Tax=Streptomyces antibioticus TaxID=1890 RepID=UPI003F47D81C
MTGLRYVYAVCRPLGAPLQADLGGVAGDPPRLLAHHGLIAVLSHVPERDFAEEPLRDHRADRSWLLETARSHQQVVDALTAVTTPLPLRPATVFPDDSAVRVMVQRHEDDFRDTLERLDGRVEWGVRVYDDTGGGPGETDEAREIHDFADRLHRTLTAHADDVRLSPPRITAPPNRPQSVLDGAYLVPRARSEEFVEAVHRAEGEVPGARVELAGPWAAYSFVDVGDLS